MSREIPDYVEGHNLLAAKSVLITAAAGAGIGFSAAKRAVEEGARAVVISDVHEGRLSQAREALTKHRYRHWWILRKWKPAVLIF